MKLMLLPRYWRALLPANKMLRPYIAHAVWVKDEDALQAISIVMRDRRWRRLLEEYRDKVNIWDAAGELLADGGAYANEETAERLKRTYELLQAMDKLVLGKGPDPFHGYYSRPHS